MPRKKKTESLEEKKPEEVSEAKKEEPEEKKEEDKKPEEFPDVDIGIDVFASGAN